MLKQVKYSLFVFALWFLAGICFSQSKYAARYEIDAKRMGVSPQDKDAMPRSREFIRLDSTYYVGWMFEGLYKYEHSADYLGFRNAIPSLRKALDLLEKDFSGTLKQMFSSTTFYYQNSKIFDDFHEIASALEQSYNTIERPDSTMRLLDRLDSYHFPKDYFDINCGRAWTYHRNRFYTSKEFYFLGNSIEENERKAFQSCYEQITSIKRNEAFNMQWFGYGQADQDLLTVYHYLAILHDYNQNYDSSGYYYNRLIEGNRVSWGNYAHFNEEQGKFSEAFDAYLKPQYRRRYSLDEEDYYLPSILMYAGRTKDAIRGSHLTIQAKGSVPGFGWYNIALARSYMYDGQLDSCEFYLDKASNFKELHINTTLTQSQYDFTINLIKIQLMDKKTALIKFFNPGWWYSPSDLWEMLMLKIQKLMLEYAVVNGLSHNPERDRLIYNLFCGESTVIFDESIFLLKDFSPGFFIKKYEEYQQNDKRKRLYKYFKYCVAKFTYEDGDEEIAAHKCESILEESDNAIVGYQGQENKIDKNFEKLFLARLYEIMATSYDNSSERDNYAGLFYDEFPQLVPFSGLKPKMNVSFSGLNDAVVQEVINDIKDCNIEFTNDFGVPKADVYFSKKDKYYEALITVSNSKGEEIVSNRQLLFKNAGDMGKEIALCLFGKGGAVKYE